MHTPAIRGSLTVSPQIQLSHRKHSTPLPTPTSQCRLPAIACKSLHKPEDVDQPHTTQQNTHTSLRTQVCAGLLSAALTLSGVPAIDTAHAAKLTPDEQANIKVFNTSKPSVVSVTNLALRRDAFTMNMMEFPQGAGSGFVWDEEGHVVTNYHVITDSANVKVTLGTDELLATVVGVDPDKDVAVLQILPATLSQDPSIDTSKPAKKSRSVGDKLTALSSSPSSSSGADSFTSGEEVRMSSSSSFGSSSADLSSSRVGEAGIERGSEASNDVGSSSSFVSDSSSFAPDRWRVDASSSGRGMDEAARVGMEQGLEQQQLVVDASELSTSPTLKKPPLPDSNKPMTVKMPKAMEAMRPLCVSTSKDLQVGQRVYAVGNPFGLDHTLTMGVVSGTGREITSLNGRPINEVIQTDAAINPGNSGGPLLDSSGCVIGITTAIYSSSGTNSGVGFAIPTDTVKLSVEQILKFGKVVRPILGISFAPDQASEQLGVKGIMVLNAMEGGPAFKAGIQGTSRDEFGRLVLGDIIRAANGETVRSSADLYRQLDKSKVGDTIDLEVLRGSSIQHVNVLLEANSTPPSQQVIILTEDPRGAP